MKKKNIITNKTQTINYKEALCHKTAYRNDHHEESNNLSRTRSNEVHGRGANMINSGKVEKEKTEAVDTEILIVAGRQTSRTSSNLKGVDDRIDEKLKEIRIETETESDNIRNILNCVTTWMVEQKEE